ncbi:arabinogalactan protein 13-like [Silene latifolia]|uniref:arabinogalactan protein 13-like n=1 Tax=Silene latifolia TaxID=37657 RepID=UPI003D780D74
MEAMRMRLVFAVLLIISATFAVQNVAAADAPAPAPASDATVFVPAALASIVAVAFGFLF